MTREYRWEGKLCFIEGVPLGVCSQCGVESIKSEVAEAIEQIFQKKCSPVKFFQFPVYELQL